MKTNKIAMTVLALILAISAVTVSVGALQPRWNGGSYVELELSFDVNTGTAYVYIEGNNGTDNICATMTLYRLNNAGAWVKQMSWAYDANAEYLCASENFTGASGRDYKLELTATVTKDGASDTITRTVYDSCL